jgi:hypothetical protein
VLAVPLFQTARGYNLVQSTVFAIAASGGYCLAMVLLSLVRERIDLSDVSSLAKGTALTLVLASILSMAFMDSRGWGTEDSMAQAAWSLLTAVLGFLAVFGIWVAIQSLVRVYSGGVHARTPWNIWHTDALAARTPQRAFLASARRAA